MVAVVVLSGGDDSACRAVALTALSLSKLPPAFIQKIVPVVMSKDEKTNPPSAKNLGPGGWRKAKQIILE